MPPARLVHPIRKPRNFPIGTDIDAYSSRQQLNRDSLTDSSSFINHPTEIPVVKQPDVLNKSVTLPVPLDTGTRTAQPVICHCCQTNNYPANQTCYRHGSGGTGAGFNPYRYRD
jgi:hypothetical protein